MFTTPIDKLVHELSKLPGVGEKTALRFALHLLRQDSAQVKALATSLLDVKEKMALCISCLTFTDTNPCAICSSPNRDPRLLCVIEDPSDLLAIERTRAFPGRYHVLHGALSPLDGIGPEKLRITELLARVQKEDVAEVVIATNITVEGEATALYLLKLLKPFDVKLTRLASGVPVGGDLEYIDASTLTRAFEERYVLE